MSTALEVLFLVGLFGVAWAYDRWLKRGVAPKEFATRRNRDEIRQQFTSKVAGHGWQIVDDDNPMVALSPVLAGRRQRISMAIAEQDGTTHVRIWVSRRWTEDPARVPYKAHTLRVRMNAFERAVAGVN